MYVSTLTKRKISNNKQYEKELTDIHGAIKILNNKQFQLSREFDVFCWQFSIFDLTLFDRLVPHELSFFLHCFFDATSLVSLWRLPYLCYKHQPGIFMAIYVMMVFLVAAPIYFLEYSLGQCSSYGASKCWEYAPAFKGIGLAMLVFSLIYIYYYGGILSYVYFMFYESFNYPLPWQYCQIGSENIPRFCETNLPTMDKEQCSTKFYIEKGLCKDIFNKELVGIFSHKEAMDNGIFVNSSTSQFVKDFLIRDENQSDMFVPNWTIFSYLALIWFVVFLGLNVNARKYLPRRSIANLFCVIPYIVMGTLLYYSFQSGYQDGFALLNKPDISLILSGALWRDAASQALLVMSVSLGRIIYLGSFNRFNQKVVQLTVFGSIFISVVSYLLVNVCVNYLGVLSKKIGTLPEKLFDEPILLILLVYGQAAKLFDFPPLFSIVVFGTFSLVGTLGMVSLCENAISNFVDRFPILYSKRDLVSCMFCVSMFLLQFIFTMPCGFYLMKVLDTTVFSWGYMYIAVMECFSIGFVYKTQTFLMDVQSVVESDSFRERPWRYFRFYLWGCLNIITPGVLSFCVLIDIIKYFADIPDRNLGIGKLPFVIHLFFLTLCFLLCLLPGLFLLRKAEGNAMKKLSSIYKPSLHWEAILPSYRSLCTVTDGKFVDSITFKTIEKDQLEYIYQGVGPVNLEFSTEQIHS